MNIRCVACLAFAAALSALPASAQTKTYIIGGDDGYGTSQCLSSGGECGKVIADAWCESRGHASADSFRKAEPDEITASTTRERRVSPQAFIITCKL